MFAWIMRKRSTTKKNDALTTLNETMTRLSSSTSYLQHRRREMIGRRKGSRVTLKSLKQIDALIAAQEDRQHQLDAVILSTHAISVWTDSTAQALECVVGTLNKNTTEGIVDALQDGLERVDDYVHMTELAPMDEAEFEEEYAKFLADTVDTETDPYLGLAMPTALTGGLDVGADRAADRPRVVAVSGDGNCLLQIPQT